MVSSLAVTAQGQITLKRDLLRWLGIGWLLVSAALAWWDMHDRWLPEGRAAITAIKLWLYWAAWAALPWSVQAMLALRQHWRRPVSWLWLAGWVLVGYSVLIEPRLLLVRTHTLALPAAYPTLRLAVVSDIHLGLFVRPWQLQRLVDVLHAQDVDAVVVAGDWVYEPTVDLHTAFAPLARLRVPVFGVLGNHDTEAPGPPLQTALRQALQAHGVQWLEGRRVSFKGWELVGLGDLWGGTPRQDLHALQLHAVGDTPRLVLMHQPDTAALLPAHSATLAVAGHTHGGQIWLPWVTAHRVLPGMSQHGWYNGLYTTQAGALFVSAGVGSIGLPARLAVPPRVDVWTISGTGAEKAGAR